MPEPPIRIELLGRCQVVFEKNVVLAGEAHNPIQDFQLLAALACAEMGQLNRDSICTIIWGGELTGQARGLLSTLLNKLHRELEAATSIDRRQLILTSKGCLTLNPQVFCSDVGDVRAWIASAKSRRRPDKALEALDEAWNLRRGPLLPQFNVAWANAARCQIDIELANGILRVLPHLLQQAKTAIGLIWAERACVLHPESGRACCLEMLFLEQDGRPDEALERADLFLSRPDGSFRNAAEAQRAREEIQKTREEIQARTKSVLSFPPPPPRGGKIVVFATLELSGQGLAERRLEFDAIASARAQKFTGARVVPFPLSIRFETAGAALDWLITCQKLLASPPWAADPPAQLRMSLDAREISNPGIAWSEAMRHSRDLHSAAVPGQLLASDAARALLAASGLLARPPQLLGRWRLSPSSLPEPLFRVHHPRLPADTTEPPRAEPAFRYMLPRNRKLCIGRKLEIAEVCQVLMESSVRVVTITGTAGVGKTALAVDAALSLVDRFSQAVWFVGCEILDDPEHIPAAVLKVLGTPGTRDGEVLARIAAALEGSEALLVLDNLEHLGSGVAAEIECLLARCPGLKCIVTSRVVPDLKEAWPVSLYPLPIPALGSGHRDSSKSPSVMLFVERARAVDPNFSLDTLNAGAIAAVCRRLEGLPLALELAALQTSRGSLAQVLDALASGFDRLQRAQTGEADRHINLHTAINGSVRILSPEQQQCFHQLAVFRGGWSLNAARAVSKDDQDRTEAHLEVLLRSSLITAAPEGGCVRYRMLESIRDYASADTPSEAGGDHARYFLELAESTERDLHGVVVPAALATLELEFGNLHAAFRWAKEREPQSALRLATALAPFWDGIGDLREGLRWLLPLLTRNWPLSEYRARARIAAGNMAVRLGEDIPASLLLLRAAAEDYRALGDLKNAAKVFTGLGIAAYLNENPDAARTAHHEGLKLKIEEKDFAGQAYAHANIGFLEYMVERLPVAEEHLREAIDLAQRHAVGPVLRDAPNNLGGVLRALGEYRDTRALLLKSLTLRRETHDLWTLSYSLSEVARLAAAKHHLPKAAWFQLATIRLRREAERPLPAPEQTREAAFYQVLIGALGEDGMARLERKMDWEDLEVVFFEAQEYLKAGGD